jgi:hypothetical protein
MTSPGAPLPFREVVDRYGLEILQSPGDLALKNGDLALTKSGDLMLNNAEYSAMFRLVRGWRFNAPTLLMLFARVFSVKDRRRELDARLNTVLANGAFDPKAANRLPTTESVEQFQALRDEIAANEVGASACAGAVVLVLNGLLQSFRDDMEATRDDWDKSEPLIGGCSVGMILTASANNFRHLDEWMKTSIPKPQQLASIRVLATAFGKSIASDGAGHPFRCEVSAEVLELLSGGNFESLARNFFAYANNMSKHRTATTS